MIESSAVIAVIDMPLVVDGRARVVGLRATGLVTQRDYERVLVPTLETALARARAEGSTLRLYYELGDGFTGYTARAMWTDARLGRQHLGDFERVAVVTDHPMIAAAVRTFGPLLSGEVRMWSVAERDAAQAWTVGP